MAELQTIIVRLVGGGDSVHRLLGVSGPEVIVGLRERRAGLADDMVLWTSMVMAVSLACGDGDMHGFTTNSELVDDILDLGRHAEQM